MKNKLVLLAILFLCACSSDTTNRRIVDEEGSENRSVDTQQTTAKKTNTKELISLKSQLKAVEKLIDLDCDNSHQCKIIGMGVSPCGGFASYKIYSEKKSNSKKLVENVNQFNQIMKLQNEKDKLVGICRHIEPPKTMCQANQCVSLNSNSLL